MIGMQGCYDERRVKALLLSKELSEMIS